MLTYIDRSYLGRDTIFAKEIVTHYESIIIKKRSKAVKQTRPFKRGTIDGTYSPHNER